MLVPLQARELRRRLRRNPGDEEAQRLLSNLLGMDAQAAGAASASAEATAGEAAPAPAAASAPEASERPPKASTLHPDLQRLEQQGTGPGGVGVDAGTLTSMLSKEIQETLQIKDQSVSLSLASRVLQWGWWCGTSVFSLLFPSVSNSFRLKLLLRAIDEDLHELAVTVPYVYVCLCGRL